ncbi:Transposase [Fuerstiella marisgermanici]|uniref:Transposase n=1 Tax=Fuerstiella marisgermanici TaxID=1891926 RepID=A0A1P8WBZ8_9PLAN|nr:Transposase [Fuerstiella marisgermanici]
MARRFHHSRHKIRKILNGDEAEPGKYPRRERQSAPKVGAFHDRILEILTLDETAPPKQRHTAMRIFERLRDEHEYAGGYDAVRRFVKKQRVSKLETFIPLDHGAGQRVEADFGEISVDFPDGRQKVNVLILVWSYSNAPFAIALPTQRTEAILEGMSQAFGFFGCVPKEVWWDNPKTVATAILKGRERTINERYAALASHFAFDPLYCMPRSGNEKPIVEIRVKTLERNWSTPVPRVKDVDELNAYLRQRCVAELDRVSSRQTDTIGVRFEEEKALATTLPAYSFDACVCQEAKVDKYQFARFDNVSYSVPRQCAFHTVTVKAYVDRVEIVHRNAVVATLVRSYSRGDQVLDPLHYLTTLERRPAALDHSNVYRNWTLPSVFLRLRERLEARHGGRAGVRQYVRVLQLLASHPVPRVQSAIEQLRGAEGADAERIIRRVEQSAARSQSSSSDSTDTHSANSLHDEGVSPDVLSVQVPMPSLDHFNQFLSSSTQGSDDDARKEKSEFKNEQPAACGGCETVVVNRSEAKVASKNERHEPNAGEVEPPTVATAHDERGVRQAGSGSGGLESDVPGLSTAVDGTGSGGALQQRVELTHQTGGVSRSEGFGQLRLLGVTIGQQTESAGAFSLRMDFRTT